MLRQLSLAVGVLVLTATVVAADRPQGDSGPGAWRSPTDSPLRPVGPISGGDTPARPDRRASGPGEVAPNAVGGSLGLPNDAGQVWRDYDISSYTARVTTTKRPEQAIIDWILLETGYEAWHAEPLGILSAGPRTLRVYHTPQMQRVVADVVERFTSSEAATYTFATRMVSVDSPSWRTGVQRLLRSVPVRTSGINAWVLAKEDAAVLMGELRRRSDFREHNSPYLMVNNGQSSLISTMHGRSYVREVTPRPNLPAGFEPVTAQIDEGFALDFSPLLSADRRMIDATIKCEINQVEKMNQVVVEIPSQMSARQRTEIDVPQMTHFRFHERFRWPVDQVLVIGLGVVALPIPVNNASLLPGVPLPMGGSPARADLLVFVDCKGRTSPAAAIPPAGRNSPANRAGY